MSFSAVAFQLSDAQVAQLPDQIIGKSTCAFSRHQLGKLGFGERFRFTTRGTNRFSAARDRWSELTDVTPTAVPSSLSVAAPVCFAAFTFDARSAFDSIIDRKSTRLNSSHVAISYAVFCLKKKRHKT